MFLFSPNVKFGDTICFRFAPNKEQTLYDCSYDKKVLISNSWPLFALLDKYWKKL